jgi:hypothetical protein
MIVEIFVAAGKGEDSLGEQRALRMQDGLGLPRIGKDAIESVEEPELSIGLSEQQGAGIASDRTASKIGDEIAAIEAGERDGGFVTLCHRDGSWLQQGWKRSNSLLYQTLNHRAISISAISMKFPG